MRDTLDILYTPLASGPFPNFDRTALLDWIAENQQQPIKRRRDASLRTEHELYPWNICYPLVDRQWRDGFQQEFPELAGFFSRAYELEPRDLHTIVLLPIRSDFIGEGFWHSDPDETGLRMYLDNTEWDRDFLRIRASLPDWNEKDQLMHIPADGLDQRFSTKTQSAAALGPQQVFFLNNIRAIHAVNVSTVGAFRIAVIVTIGRRWRDMPSHVKSLIERSAQQYPEHARLRQI